MVFPSAGRWTYAVDDDFSQVHELGSVRIGAGEVGHGGRASDVGRAHRPG